MIQMKSGVYGAKDGLKRASDGPFRLSEKEEARLVNRGVAEYVYEHLPISDDEAPSMLKYDMSMTEKQLRGIAAYFQVDVSSAKKKQDIIDLLDAALKEDESEDEPEDDTEDEDPGDDQMSGDTEVDPALGAETPTV